MSAPTLGACARCNCLGELEADHICVGCGLQDAARLVVLRRPDAVKVRPEAKPHACSGRCKKKAA